MDFESYKAITFSRAGRVLTVTLNRPETMNAVDAILQDELSRVFAEAADDPGSDVIVLTGTGRAFSVGGDLKWMKAHLYEERDFPRVVGQARATVLSILDCPKPIVARLNGDAVGLGATIALMCDLIVAVDSARISDPHVRIGLAAGDGGAVIWPQLVGFARAKEFLLLGGAVDAMEAARIGLINRAVAAEDLDRTVEGLTSALAGGAQLAIRYTKMAVNLQLKQVFNTVFDAGLAFEGLTMGSRDHAEAVDAFLERRKPVFGAEG